MKLSFFIECSLTCFFLTSILIGKSKIIPKGFVKLPDHLQQKQIQPGTYINNNPSYYEENVVPPSVDFSYDYDPQTAIAYPDPYYSADNEPDLSYASGFYPDSSSRIAPRPCENVPLPQFRNDDFQMRCNFRHRFRRFYFDPSQNVCRSYTTCQGLTFNPYLNTIKNSFDTLRECRLSCYSTGTCCSRSNQNNDFGRIPNYYVPTVTLTNYFICNDGRRIPMTKKCDGIFNCAFAEDEINCAIHESWAENFEIASLTSQNFERTLFNSRSNKFVIVDFHAPWCPACVKFEPEFKKVYRKWRNRNVTFFKVNVEAEPDLGQRFGIDTFPRILLWNVQNSRSPFRYHKSFGLTSKRLSNWLEEVVNVRMPNFCGLMEFPCLINMACLSNRLVCDKKINCYDSSDEKFCLTWSTTKNTIDNNQPQNSTINPSLPSNTRKPYSTTRKSIKTITKIPKQDFIKGGQTQRPIFSSVRVASEASFPARVTTFRPYLTKNEDTLQIKPFLPKTTIIPLSENTEQPFSTTRNEITRAKPKSSTTATTFPIYTATIQGSSVEHEWTLRPFLPTIRSSTGVTDTIIQGTKRQPFSTTQRTPTRPSYTTKRNVIRPFSTTTEKDTTTSYITNTLAITNPSSTIKWTPWRPLVTKSYTTEKPNFSTLNSVHIPEISKVTPVLPRSTTYFEVISTSTTTNYITASTDNIYEVDEDFSNIDITSSVIPINTVDTVSSSPRHCNLKCRDGSCIKFEDRCNGIYDCRDGVDEENCGSCKRTQFTCKSNKKCIDYWRRCDDQADCEDGSDELYCEFKCKRNEFFCEEGGCINFAKRCDGTYDCPDKSDEKFCPTRCNSTLEFTCNDGKCINKDLFCDGIPHCHDTTDEISCNGECDLENEWRCLSGNICINARRRCDGYPDCPDLSDEDIDLCPKVQCNDEWQFQCFDRKRCIDSRRICDGYDDCIDGSDEYDCLSVKCHYWQYKCKTDGVCVDSRRKCDGYNDCEDSSDEAYCDNLTTTSYEFEHNPTTKIGLAYRDVLMDCLVTEPSVIWTYNGAKVINNTKFKDRLGSDFNNGSLMILNVLKDDEGYYTCASLNGKEIYSVYLRVNMSLCTNKCKDEKEFEQVCGSNGKIYSSPCELIKASCELKQSILPTPMQFCNSSTSILLNCALDERQCFSNPEECIEEIEICDGTSHCSDNSDELLCSRDNLKFFYYGKNVTVIVNDSTESKIVRIKCELEGDFILWWFKERLITENSAHEIDHSHNMLIITDVRRGDEGWYRCRNMKLEEYSLHLNIEYPALATGGPAELSFLVGEKGIIPCPTDANPPVSNTAWHKNGRPIGYSRSSLVLHNITSIKDRGDYVCTPYNARGTMGPSKKVSVRVRTRFYECPAFCSAQDYNPVCGSDGLTYASECMLIKTSCNSVSKKNLYLLYPYQCSSNEVSTHSAYKYSEDVPKWTTIMNLINGTIFDDVEQSSLTNSTTITPISATFVDVTSIPSSPTTTSSTTEFIDTLAIPYYNISCPNHKWTCDDGSCIPLVRQCDGAFDCPDGEDEKFCQNIEQRFICGNVSLNSSQVCDGYPHCENGEDEGDCPLNIDDGLTPGCYDGEEYECDDFGKCICTTLKVNSLKDTRGLVEYSPTMGLEEREEEYDEEVTGSGDMW